MPYDQDLQHKIDAIYRSEKELTFKKMFGGVCYLFRGNMAFGIYRDNLIVRLGSESEAKRAIDSGQALPFDITGKAMKGWVMIPGSRLESLDQYKRWLDKGLTFARALPRK